MGKCRLLWSNKKESVTANRRLCFAQTIVRNAARGNLSTLIAALRLNKIPQILPIIKDPHGHTLLCLLLHHGKESDALCLYDHYHSTCATVHLCSSGAAAKAISAAIAATSPDCCLNPIPLNENGESASAHAARIQPHRDNNDSTDESGGEDTPHETSSTTPVRCLYVLPESTPFHTFRVIWKLICESGSARGSANSSTSGDRIPSADSPPPPYAMNGWKAANVTAGDAFAGYFESPPNGSPPDDYREREFSDELENMHAQDHQNAHEDDHESVYSNA